MASHPTYDIVAAPGVAVVYRVQDHQGRGPYRPGFQSKWCDPEHDARNPAGMHEFPHLYGQMPLQLRGEWDAYGYGFRSIEQAHRWFSPMERVRLLWFGYLLMAMPVQEIVAESPLQLLFWRDRPLLIDVKVLFLDRDRFEWRS